MVMGEEKGGMERDGRRGEIAIKSYCVFFLVSNVTSDIKINFQV